MSTISVSLTGPLFAGSPQSIVIDAVGKGIEKLVIKGEALVKEQLYPGHGKRSGRLRESINGRVETSLRGVIDSRDGGGSSPVVYTSWIEGTSARNARSSFAGYGMFAKAHGQLAAVDLNSVIASEITGALS